MLGMENAISKKENEDKESSFLCMDSSAHKSVSDGSAVFRGSYQKLMYALNHDQKLLKEVSMGRRIGFYRVRGDLGTGNFSQVKVAVHDLCKERVAIKILDKSKFDERTRQMVSREILAMDTIHHPNIIRLYEVLETYNRIHLVLEYACGGELFNRITTVGRFPESDARVLFAQISSAVKYMHTENRISISQTIYNFPAVSNIQGSHDMKFIHRDIKAENVFFAAPTVVKIGDFGFSIELKKGHNQLLTTFCGSPPYAAPELFRDDSYIGAPVDIWALGVLLYFMVSGHMPFKAQTVATLKKHITDGNYSIPSHVSLQCKAVIEGTLKQCPQDRLTLSDILNSEWLTITDVLSTPGLTEKYSLIPSTLQCKRRNVIATKTQQNYGDGIISDIELKAHNQLHDLGITDAMLQESIEHGVRNAVIGTYRITVHQLQGKLLLKNKSNVENTCSQSEHASGCVLLDKPTFYPVGHKSSFHLRRRSRSSTMKQNSTKELKSRSRTCDLL